MRSWWIFLLGLPALFATLAMAIPVDESLIVAVVSSACCISGYVKAVFAEAVGYDPPVRPGRRDHVIARAIACVVTLVLGALALADGYDRIAFCLLLGCLSAHGTTYQIAIHLQARAREPRIPRAWVRVATRRRR